MEVLAIVLVAAVVAGLVWWQQKPKPADFKGEPTKAWDKVD